MPTASIAHHWIERAMFLAYDYTYFATDFHIGMFAENLFHVTAAKQELIDDFVQENQIVRTGWPMEYMDSVLAPYANVPKRDLILFPHRISPEKRVDIFHILANRLPQYEWVVAQESTLSKAEYHALLASAKIVFSASVQETLGICAGLEAPIANAIPLCPDRLSYSELFADYPAFLYPDDWTDAANAHVCYLDQLCEMIVETMENYDNLLADLASYRSNVMPNYFHATALVENIKNANYH
jgi:glycosyltransferase involved in cell wall biosynthesis